MLVIRRCKFVDAIEKHDDKVIPVRLTEQALYVAVRMWRPGAVGFVLHVESVPARRNPWSRPYLAVPSSGDLCGSAGDASQERAS